MGSKLRVIQKTRTRTPRSCFACRKKKRKCDRGTPCMNCVKSKTVDLCVYEQFEEPTISTKNAQTALLTEELKASQERIKYLETLVLLKFNDPSLIAFDKLPREDEDGVDLKLTLKYDTMLIDHGRLVRTGPTSMKANIVNDSYCRRFISEYSGIQTKGPRTSIKDGEGDVSVVDTVNINKEVEQAKILFPELSFVLPLINRFFEYGPSSSAILEKDRFLLDVWTIIDTNGKEKLKIKESKHYVILAELLVVLRSAYVTFLRPDHIGDDEILKDIRSGKLDVPSKLSDIAGRILSSLETPDSSTLFMVRANILYIHYRRFSREGYRVEEYMLLRLNSVAQILRYHGLTTECPNAKDFLTASEIFSWKQLWVMVLSMYSSLCFDAGVSFPVPEEELNILVNLGGEKSIIKEIPSMRVLAMKICWVKILSSIIRDSHKPEGISRENIFSFINDSNSLLVSMNSIEQLLNDPSNVKERLEEFRLRIDLMVKLFSTHFKFSSILIEDKDRSLRTKQYMQAFAYGLTIFRLASDLMTNTHQSDLWSIISSSIYNALVKVSVLVSSLYTRIYEGVITGVEFVTFLQSSQFNPLVEWLGLSQQKLLEPQVIASLNEKFWNVYDNLKTNPEADFFKSKSYHIIKTYLIPYFNQRFDFPIFRQDEQKGADLSLNEPDIDFAFLWDDYFDINFGSHASY
ncbi:uncharacterized protein PRCAT00005236001 [Priceomyces carsonii]|uniref:uncharacterized protein n=1 Tax=Priceomyces carsonii TaxID=28549 RepID=UPI002EDB841A|nr:unnamed protein product [Priceomyces carsonii]